MKLKDQVVSLELAKKLKELGVKQESLYLWTLRTEPATLWSLDRYGEKWGNNIGEGYDKFSAFTVAELGEMLLDTVQSNAYDEEEERLYYVCRLNVEGDWSKYIHITNAATEADARAKMLIYLIENNLVTI